MGKAEDKKYLELWKQYRDNTAKSTPVDLNETPAEKRNRMIVLENNHEAWFKYYFPNHYTSEPAPFHIAATRRVMNNPEWFEVRSWSRECSKTSRTRMEVLYLVLTGKKKMVVLASDTFDRAKRLLLPYKVQFESNNRLINDYGAQQSLGHWEASEFITKKGAAFIAIGAGMSPRGVNNDAVRPDVILIDDIDTDEECRNPDRVTNKVKWLFEALYASRSISNPLLWIANGNIIAKYCCITEMAKQADIHDIVNIRDKNGISTWLAKNTEAFIDRVLSKMPWSAQQKEFYNNPVSSGSIFKDLIFDKCPTLKTCDQVVIYADPSTSNKDRGRNKQASYKAVVVVGSKGRKRYCYKCWVQQTSNAKFVDFMYEAYLYVKENGVDTVRVVIENNSLQDPHYQQVVLPLIYEKSANYGFTLPISEDKRKKPDKFFRIEGTLEPLHRLGNLIFNIKEEKSPDMMQMKDQTEGVSENAKIMDAPDALEGGVWLIQNRTIRKNTSYKFGSINSRRF